MSETEKAAEELACSCKSITDLQCPRNIKNPGLWFGFMKGAEFERKRLEKEYEDLKRNLIETYKANNG